MNNIQTRSVAIFAALAALMAATRYNHFGSDVALPDASLAIFFLGGMYLSARARLAAVTFAGLILEAGLIDWYATSVQGIDDWCMTPAYWFLLPTYASLWLAGRWFAPRHTLQSKGLVGLVMVAWAATSFAYAFSNVAFYLFSGRFADMTAVEYVSRVSQYYGSYVSVALLYIACAVAVEVLFRMAGKPRMQESA